MSSSPALSLAKLNAARKMLNREVDARISPRVLAKHPDATEDWLVAEERRDRKGGG